MSSPIDTTPLLKEDYFVVYASLSIITCMISVFCVLLMTITYIVFRKKLWRQSRTLVVLMNINSAGGALLMMIQQFYSIDESLKMHKQHIEITTGGVCHFTGFLIAFNGICYPLWILVIFLQTYFVINPNATKMRS